MKKGPELKQDGAAFNTHDQCGQDEVVSLALAAVYEAYYCDYLGVVGSWLAVGVGFEGLGELDTKGDGVADKYVKPLWRIVWSECS